MNDETVLLKNRLSELASRAARAGVYTHTGFLSPAEQAVLAALVKKLPAPCTLYSGAENCERALAVFGDESLCGYPPVSPVVCLRILPAGGKFAGPLGHRDFLGALLNLGLSRDALGDIVVQDGAAYVFSTESAARLALDALTRVGREPVRCALCADAPADASPETEELTVQVTGLRLDALIARAFRLSREDAAALFPQKRVFRNGAQEESASRAPAEGDVVSVRGLGRFRFLGVTGTSKKGKLNVRLAAYPSAR